MATTGPISGTLYKITTAGTSVSDLTSNSVDFTVATRDVTTKDSAGNMEVLPTILSASYSFEAIVALDAAHGLEEVYDQLVAKAAIAVVFTTSVSGDVQWTQQGYATSVNITAGNEDNVTLSATIQGTGAITKADVV